MSLDQVLYDLAPSRVRARAITPHELARRTFAGPHVARDSFHFYDLTIMYTAHDTGTSIMSDAHRDLLGEEARDVLTAAYTDAAIYGDGYTNAVWYGLRHGMNPIYDSLANGFAARHVDRVLSSLFTDSGASFSARDETRLIEGLRAQYGKALETDPILTQFWRRIPFARRHPMP